MNTPISGSTKRNFKSCSGSGKKNNSSSSASGKRNMNPSSSFNLLVNACLANNDDVINPFGKSIDTTDFLSGIDDDYIPNSADEDEDEIIEEEAEEELEEKEEWENAAEVEEDELEVEDEMEEDKKNCENIGASDMGPVTKIARYACNSRKVNSIPTFTIQVGYGTAFSKATNHICGTERSTSITRCSLLPYDCIRSVRETPLQH